MPSSAAPRHAPGPWSRGALFALGLGALSLTACGDTTRGPAPAPAPETCAPACDGKACGPDGCGGSCGACPSGEVCTIDAQCVATAPPADCAKSCADLGYDCGEHCGASCGTCDGPQESCRDHACVCEPRCGAARCGVDDGCGGTCAPCTTVASCADCPLRLSVVSRELTSGAAPRITSVTLALDFSAAMGSPLPGMADLRLQVEGPAELAEVAIGESLISARKGLFNDPDTGLPWRLLPDGTVQLLVLSTTSQADIPPGRWLFLTFRFERDEADLLAAPLQVALIEREEVFAPVAADGLLRGQRFGGPVVIWADDLEVSNAP
jgi:hypothetical protein